MKSDMAGIENQICCSHTGGTCQCTVAFQEKGGMQRRAYHYSNQTLAIATQINIWKKLDCHGASAQYLPVNDYA